MPELCSQPHPPQHRQERCPFTEQRQPRVMLIVAVAKSRAAGSADREAMTPRYRGAWQSSYRSKVAPTPLVNLSNCSHSPPLQASDDLEGDAVARRAARRERPKRSGGRPAGPSVDLSGLPRELARDGGSGARRRITAFLFRADGGFRYPMPLPAHSVRATADLRSTSAHRPPVPNVTR